MTAEVCGDNRFEIIEKAKTALLESTNIDTSKDEMKVLDSFLFRCWQMGWLDKYDDTKGRPHGEWIRKEMEINDYGGLCMYEWYECSVCGGKPPYNQWKHEVHSDFCPHCGAKMTEQTDDIKYKIPGTDEVMEKLDKLKLRGDNND